MLFRSHDPTAYAYTLSGELMRGADTSSCIVDLKALRAQLGVTPSSFSCTVALDETPGLSQAAAPFRFAVILDSELVWLSPDIINVRTASTVCVEVGSAQQLIMAVETTQSCAVNAVWVDPHLTCYYKNTISPEHVCNGLQVPRRVSHVLHKDGREEFVPEIKVRSMQSK